MNIETGLKLNNGIEIPVLGLGVFESGDKTKDAVRFALEYGYRHIDTAKAYYNESFVARGIKESGVKREDIFITTKLWNDDMRAHRQEEAIKESLEALETDYIDLYLIHWPVKDVFIESWKIMEEYYKNGVFHAIGVSNFHDYHMKELLEIADIVPAVNQIEINPYLSQYPLVEFNSSYNIATECWSPLGRGSVLDNPVLLELGVKYQKSVPQIVLRWEIQRGLITIPKSVHEERIAENADIFDFSLSKEDMEKIDSLNKNERSMPSANPDTFTF